MEYYKIQQKTDKKDDTIKAFKLYSKINVLASLAISALFTMRK
jgi:hypothetical protein